LVISYGFGLGELVTIIPAYKPWYFNLNKPDDMLPIGVLILIGFLVHTLLGVSIYLVLEKQLESGVLNYIPSKIGFLLGTLLLFVQLVWVYVFFWFASPENALTVLMVLWPLTAATLLQYLSIQSMGGFSLVPYLMWVTYLFYINNQIIMLN
jgi:tryptophan-rich sensory protein